MRPQCYAVGNVNKSQSFLGQNSDVLKTEFG
jgi:hypothetical protein